MGLEPRAAWKALLEHPFQVARLGAYWDRLERNPGHFDTEDLDWQLDAAAQAGREVILCVGAVKTFGYPECFIPRHRLPAPLPEGVLIDPAGHPELAEAAVAFVTRLVRRYRGHPAITAWQVEHEAVDPLGMEHSWRLSTEFVRLEVEAVRAADPSRPVIMNGFLPTSLPVGLQQSWRTRDQGDSLRVAEMMADVVGIDYYPRHALVGGSDFTIYLEGVGNVTLPWERGLFARARRDGRPLLVSEGQAEPWEAVTTPPAPSGRHMRSCRAEDVIENYNRFLRRALQARLRLDAYLFWGAEYWLLRERSGDPSYLMAFDRVIGESEGC